MGMGYSDRLFDSQVEIDLEATKEWYSRGKEWGCECAHCRNFLELARNKQSLNRSQTCWRALVSVQSRPLMSANSMTMSKDTTTNSAIA